MPRQPEWIQRLELITAQLEAGSQSFPGELIDRSMVEQLFGVKPRQATRILHRLGARTVGGALLMEQTQMLTALQALSQGREVQWEQHRREKLIQKLEQLRREARARQIQLEVPPQGALPGGEFPEGIQLRQGRLEIVFQNPVELMRKMMQLAQLAAQDWNVFVERIR